MFFRDGQALDLFGPGRHTLTTQNLPFLRRIINFPTNGETPFHCEVYFINKTEQMAIKWGTDSKIQYMEPTYQFPLEIGASGEMSLRAEDSRKLLVRLVGTERQFGHKELMQYFRAFLITHLKSYLVHEIQEKRLSIFEIDGQMDRISEDLKKRLWNDFMDYGLSLERFLVTTIVKPDGDAAYETFKSIHFRQYADVAQAQLKQRVGIIEEQTQAQRRVIDAQGMAEKRRLEGYTYQQERGFDVAEKVAQNEGTGEFTSAGMGLGMMVGVGGAVSGSVGGIFQSAMGNMAPIPPPPPVDPLAAFCENCGAKLVQGARFCEQCGAPSTAPAKPVCSGCGYQFERPGKFCPKCGKKRGDPQNETS